MASFVVRVLISAAGLWLAAKIVPGVEATSLGSLLAAALLLGVANAVVRPILIVLTLPITLLSLGLFLLVINGAMIKLVALFLHGFIVHGWLAAILASLVVSATGWAASWLVHSDGRNDR